MREAEASIRTKKNDAAMTAEPVVEVRNRVARGDLRSGAGGDAVRSPLAQNQFHDRLAPSREGDGGGEIVCIAATADKRRIANAARRLVERAAG